MPATQWYQRRVAITAGEFGRESLATNMACDLSNLLKLHCVFFIWMLPILARGYILISPSDTETSVGEKVTLNCMTSSGRCEWYHFMIEATSHEVVYKDGNIFNGYKQRFMMSPGNGDACNLVINNVTLDDAGSYTCMETATQQKAMELVVLGNYPSNNFCTAKYVCAPKCDNLELSCRLRYRGNIIPVLEWRESIGDIMPSTADTMNDITISITRVKVDESTSDSFICSVRYLSSALESKYVWSHQAQVVRNRSTIDGHYKVEQQSHTVSTTTLALLIAFLCMVSLTAGIVCICLIRSRKLLRGSKRSGDNIVADGQGHKPNSSNTENRLTLDRLDHKIDDRKEQKSLEETSSNVAKITRWLANENTCSDLGTWASSVHVDFNEGNTLLRKGTR